MDETVEQARQNHITNMRARARMHREFAAELELKAAQHRKQEKTCMDEVRRHELHLRRSA